MSLTCFRCDEPRNVAVQYSFFGSHWKPPATVCMAHGATCDEHGGGYDWSLQEIIQWGSRYVVEHLKTKRWYEPEHARPIRQIAANALRETV